ncbi:arylsulfatase [Maribacter sp. MJ134]|uniref:sulfatase family protein n=1 Tax=Maribacter sp. MJ134 TaxID=2496865 RepID=UPI000F82EE0B|nr:sulfatase [Maribacter sp. MJ134]AZQ59310.1 arylsulfatase [Maribacter sp. MJ134]
MKINNRFTLRFHFSIWLYAISCTILYGQEPQVKPPNFIIIFADDLGYGDIGVFGNPSIKTPNLDAMAFEGQKWTNFYAAASVCTPSRAGLLTGRLPVRSGMASNGRRVLFPNSKNGLPASEITLAEQLKKAGYTTAAIGKWHLGHKEKFLPTNNGFDSYFGIPYSNDMDRVVKKSGKEYWNQPNDSIKTEHFNVPLLRGNKVVERPANQNNITKRYSEEAVAFIENQGEKPFFLYLAHNLPHIPLFASEDFLGKSKRGLYGDVIEEIDHGVGNIISALKAKGLQDNTIVVFTSDNGPWLPFKDNAGSAGPLRAGKGTTWEGGMREPTVFWGPGLIKTAVISDIGSSLDFFTTFSAMANIPTPKDVFLDGKDLSETLRNGAPSPRNSILYYRGTELFAVRLGDFKAHYRTQGAYGQFGERKEHEVPLLYNLVIDPGEHFNVADAHPKVIEQIKTLVVQHTNLLVMGEDQLIDRE